MLCASWKYNAKTLQDIHKEKKTLHTVEYTCIPEESICSMLMQALVFAEGMVEKWMDV